MKFKLKKIISPCWNELLNYQIRAQSNEWKSNMNAKYIKKALKINASGEHVKTMKSD